jgi:hypothetical protein
MARWLVECVHGDPGDLAAGALRFRIFPEGEPDRWIAETNSSLPVQVQEEMALQIADALFNLLGI